MSDYECCVLCGRHRGVWHDLRHYPRWYWITMSVLVVGLSVLGWVTQ